MARGRLLADDPWSSACGWPVVVYGWPVVVYGWPEVFYGWPEVVYGWPEVIYGLAKVIYGWMARGRPAADGPWSSGCGWPVVVRLRMARGRLRMARGHLRIARGRLRMARGRLRMASSRLRMARGRLCDRGQRWPGLDPLVGCSTLVRGSSVSVGLPTTLASIAHFQKKKCAQAGTVGGTARVHERNVEEIKNTRV